MENLTFLKFGGSAITDKNGQEVANTEVITSLAEELYHFLSSAPDQRVLIGHGSGSFGHYYAAQYRIHEGLTDDADWKGFALTSAAALRLNRIVVDALLQVGVPALAVQPSAALRSEGGRVVEWSAVPIEQALTRRLVPVIHGDVVFDAVQGCAIISTESLFAALARIASLQPSRIIIIGEDAVYTADPHIDPTAEPIPVITSSNIEQVREMTGGASAADVTGGMRSKVELMWSLVETIPGLEVHIIDFRPGVLQGALRREFLSEGTIIRK
jgi:isopentenyl phosphate kinase